jgi:hypothetical protein
MILALDRTQAAHSRERLGRDSLAVALHLLNQPSIIAAMPNILRAINKRRDSTVG